MSIFAGLNSFIKKLNGQQSRYIRNVEVCSTRKTEPTVLLFVDHQKILQGRKVINTTLHCRQHVDFSTLSAVSAICTAPLIMQLHVYYPCWKIP